MARPSLVHASMGPGGRLLQGRRAKLLPFMQARRRPRLRATSPPHQLRRAFLRSLGGSAMKVERNCVLCAALQRKGAVRTLSGSARPAGDGQNGAGFERKQSRLPHKEALQYRRGCCAMFTHPFVHPCTCRDAALTSE